MQLRQSGAVFHHIPQVGGAESCLARLNGATLVVGSSPPDVRHMGLHGQSLASAGGPRRPLGVGNVEYLTL